MPIECSHPRPELNMPNRASGASRVTFSVPPIIPGLGAEANRVLQSAFRSIAENLARLSSRGATVPLVDAITYARDGQTITGTASGGEVIVLPQPPAEDGVRIVLDSVGGDVSVIAPDGTQTTISTPGVYDFAPTGDPSGTYETPPGAPVLASMTSPRVLGRETAGNGAVEQLTVQGGLELNTGLQIANNGVLLGKLVGAPNAGFVGSTGLGDYEHLTRATVAAAFASTSIVAVGAELQRAAVTGDVLVLQNSNTAAINTDAVDNTKLANMAQDRIKGRSSGAGTGDPQDLTATQVVTIIGNAMGGVLASTSIVQSGTQLQRAAVGGDVTAAQNSNTLTIGNDAVTNAKLNNMVQATIKGRASGAGTGDPQDLTASQAATIISGAGVFGELASAQSWTAANTFQAQLRISSVVSFESSLLISTSASSLDDTDINPNDHNVVKITGTVFLEVTGITVARSGQLLAVVNGSTVDSLDLLTEDTGSSTINRFTFGGTDVRLGPARGALLLYDGNSSRWRALFGFP